MYLFQKYSAEIHSLISNQPFVGERSLFDFLLYSLSKELENFRYKLLEESEFRGESLPLELLVITSGHDSRFRFCHKFLILPKKLSSATPDLKERFGIFEGENGIVKFIKTAERLNAYPLYLICSDYIPDENESRNGIFKTTKGKLNGVYICPAPTVKRLIDNHGESLNAVEILKSCYNVSLIDSLISLSPREAYRTLSEFKFKRTEFDVFEGCSFDFEYINLKIPQYATELFQHKNSRGYLPKGSFTGIVGGISVLDLTRRGDKGYRRPQKEDWHIASNKTTHGYK